MHFEFVGPGFDALGVNMLHLGHSFDGIGVLAEHHQHAIPQIFNHLAAPRCTDLAHPVGQAGDGLRGFGVTQGLKDSGASGQIGKNDGDFCHG